MNKRTQINYQEKAVCKEQRQCKFRRKLQKLPYSILIEFRRAVNSKFHWKIKSEKIKSRKHLTK